MITPYREISNEIQSKVEQLKDLTLGDISSLTGLWNETFVFRRQVVRDQATSDIINTFPAYSNDFLVNLFCLFFLYIK